MDIIEQGCLDIWIDDIVPCLKDTKTEELKDTVVFTINSRSYLKKFKKKDGWHIDWAKVPPDVEVCALALLDTNEIQGLVGVKKDEASKAAFIHWACTAPQNNIHEYGEQKYSGVGGHLFAIAVDKSLQWGYDGVVHGFAANMDLVNHYVDKFHAEHLGMLHEYQIVINEDAAQELMEVYNYEWNDTTEIS